MQASQQAISPNNLPHPLTSFIGREDDIAAVKQSLASTRLLTLAGVGGSGKTRLAREVALAALDEFPDGVWWTDLAPLAVDALIPQALATACRVIETQGQVLLEALVTALAPTRTLLILDNCEHLVDTCAQMAQTLLTACPTVTILATSRETLNIAGETVYLVPTLDVPEERLLHDLERIGRFDSIRLFVERARAVSSPFTLSEATAPVVLRICRRIEGIPLAIELAAARIRVLSLEEIAERLTAAIPLLTSGRRTASPRQQTLRATLDWSYNLLAEPEAVLFRRLAVFAGGFTLDAAESVCADETVASSDVLDLLGHLVDKSLVLVQEDQGAKRYGLLEIIRQYNQAKLDLSGDAIAVRTRHKEYFVALAEVAESGLEGAAQLQWLNRLEREHDNFRACIQWTIDQGRQETAAHLAACLWRFWLVRGYVSEGRRWLQQTLDSLSGDTQVRAEALHALSILTFHHEGYGSAIALTEETLALCRRLGDKRGTATAVLILGILAHSHGDYARAVACFEESLPLCWEVNYVHGAALSLSSMGLATLHLGDLTRARALCDESVNLARSIGDIQSVAGSLTNLGIALLESRSHQPAMARFIESLEIRRRLGNKGGAAHTLFYMGRTALEQGDYAQADGCFQESFSLRDELGDQGGLAAALEGLAAVAAASGTGTVAARRFGAAEIVRERIGMPIPIIDRPFNEHWVSVTRTLLGESDFTALWSTGREITPQEAMGSPSYTRVATNQADGSNPDASHRATAPRAGADKRPMPELQIFVLGETRVYLKGRLLTPAEWTYAKARELLLFLLAHGPATKEQIGLALWPDADQAQVRAQLHPTLHHLRRALGGQERVLFERGKYRFNRGLSYTYDAEAFQAHLAQARREERDTAERALQRLKSAARLYCGDFLADVVGGEWIERYRDELRRQWLDALTLLGSKYYDAGDYAHGIDIYRRLIEADPFQEHAHRELMRCLSAQGEHAQALRHFVSLARLFKDELGATPAPETTALANLLRSGESL